MDVADFDFELPAERIAQHPVEPRDRSRLLVLDRRTGALEHRRFDDVTALLRQGDLLVLNDTRVVPARLVGRKATGGRVELLLLERAAGAAGEGLWRCLVRGGKSLDARTPLEFGAGLRARVVGREGRTWLVRLEAQSARVEDLLERVGQVPLPPYIRRDAAGPTEEDRGRYQTVYARSPGAVAAPTAGLHFTEELLARLGAAGVEVAFVTLHVGLGTFEPLRVPRVEQHKMHAEAFDLPEAASQAVVAARRRGGRIVAVGTTVVRVLETCACDDGTVQARAGRSDLFIHPGFGFRVVDAMLTNFHLPRSTLLMLVCAFGGREPVLAAYRQGVQLGYRFYSYGDAMFVGTP